MRSAYLAFLLVCCVGIPTPLAAQADGDAAFLFAYRIKPDLNREFMEGYRRHLDWHAEHQDSLTWLAWIVFSGSGLGTFVDGSFGLASHAFDVRVDPRGDAADAATNVAPYGDPTDRHVYRLRRDLGSAARLEEGQPAAMQLVASLTVRPGDMEAFERGLRRLAAGQPRLLDYAVYEGVAGGPQPVFLVIVQLDTWEQLDDSARNPVRAILRTGGEAITHADTGVWLYRADLTYFPAR